MSQQQYNKIPFVPGSTYVSPVKVGERSDPESSRMLQVCFDSGFEDPIVLPVWGTEEIVKHWLVAAAMECSSRPVSVHVALDAFFAQRGNSQPLNVSRRFLGYRTQVFFVSVLKSFWKVERGRPLRRIPVSVSDFEMVERFQINCANGSLSELPVEAALG